MTCLHGEDRYFPKLICPTPGCGARLMDAGSRKVKNGTTLFVFDGQRPADYIIRCNKCRKIIGIEIEKG
jgi:hypothetical protein